MLQPVDKEPWMYFRIYPEPAKGETVAEAKALAERLVPDTEWNIAGQHVFTLFNHPGAFDPLTLTMYIYKFRDAGISRLKQRDWQGAADVGGDDEEER